MQKPSPTITPRPTLEIVPATPDEHAADALGLALSVTGKVDVVEG
jgi:hypothetical protein